MPVLVTNEFPPPAHGGIERYMVRLAGEVFRAGHPIAVVAPWTKDCNAFDRELPYPVIRFPLRRQDPVPVQLFRMACAAARAHHGFVDRSTIAASWIRSGAACAMLPYTIRGPLAILAHGSEILSQRSGLNRTVMRATFSQAAVVAANSTFTSRILADAGIMRNVVVARCGADPQPLVRTPSPRPTVLSVGRLVRRKGFDRTIEALAILRERFPDVLYEIVGSGPDEAYLRDLTASLDLQAHVSFLGAVSDAEAASAYARAWCFSLPSRRVGGDVEGFGIVYLEAAMAGLPSIGGKGSGAEDAIEDGRSGVLVDPDDPAAIAKELGGLLGDSERAQRMGMYGRVRALEQFSWSGTARTVMDALARVQMRAECYSP